MTQHRSGCLSTSPLAQPGLVTCFARTLVTARILAVLIAEELLLIAFDPDTGRAPTGSQDYLKVGVSGALLAELVLAGRLVLDQGRIAAVPGEVLGDPLLAAVLEAVAGDLLGRKSKVVVQKLSKALGGARDQVVDRLVDAGILSREKKGFLWTTRHRVIDRPAQNAVLAEVRGSAAGQGPLDARQAVLLAFAGPCRREGGPRSFSARPSENPNKGGHDRCPLRSRGQEDHR